MNTFESTLTNLRCISRQAERDGVDRSKRAAGLTRRLAKLRTFERKTEPFRQNWLDQCEAYETHIAELSA